jgi:hypothetical protein
MGYEGASTQKSRNYTKNHRSSALSLFLKILTLHSLIAPPTEGSSGPFDVQKKGKAIQTKKPPKMQKPQPEAGAFTR